MWTANTSVSSHMGLNPAGPASQDGEKRRKRVDGRRISVTNYERRGSVIETESELSTHQLFRVHGRLRGASCVHLLVLSSLIID